jgi:ribosome-associated heat shock protein Hsp15
MRLDRFLWFARFARTRSAAQVIASDGHLRITGRPATSNHAPVRVGDVLTFVREPQVQVIRIEALPHRRGPAPEARACYTDLTIANVSQEASHD